MSKMIEFVRSSVKDFGLIDGSYVLVCWGLGQLIGLRIFQGVAIKAESIQPDFLELDPKYGSRFVSKAEMSEYVGEEFDLPEDFLNECFAKGDRCYAIFDGNRLASYGFYSQKPTRASKDLNDGIVIHFDPSVVYQHKGYTHPDYRGERLFAVGTCRALERYAQEGVDEMICFATSTNFSSLKAFYRLGYRNFGKIYIFKIRGTWRFIAEPSCKRYKFLARYEPQGSNSTS